MISLFTALCTLLMLTSCTAKPETTYPGNGEFSITAVPVIETRTAVDNTFNVSWSAGDSVRVYHSPAGTGEFVDDGCFIYDAAAGCFKGTLARGLTPGNQYEWKVRYPYNDRGEVSEFTQKGSSNTQLAGPCIPLEGHCGPCPAEERPTVPMHQTMAALKLTLRNDDMEALVPARIVFSCEGCGNFTLTLEEKKAVSWDTPRTYYIPFRPFTAKAGTAAGIKVYTSRGHSLAKTLTFEEDREFLPGTVTEAECLLVPQRISEDELFSASTKTRMMQMLETFHECGINHKGQAVTLADDILSRMNEDGSWPDINYASTHSSNWSPITHAGNIQNLARAWHVTKDNKYMDAARLALAYWDKRKPYSSNWWFNEVDVPMVMAPAFLLLQEGFDTDDMERADRVFAKAYLGLTGQNKLWMAGIVLQRGLFNKDYDMVMAAWDSIFSEIRLTTEEGIQPDYSFHQHGRIMQTGVYGLVFAQDMAKWYYIFSGTPLAIQGSRKAILSNYLEFGQDWLVWKGYYDPNVFGRQINEGKDIANAETVNKAHTYLGTTMSEPKGGRYYPYSDLGVYRTTGWYASVRMQSNHLVGIENTLSENMKGYFASDGALLIRRTGTEYLDIWPCWDWKHIPGATTYDDGKPLWGCSGSQPYNKTDKVFGEVCGDVLVVAMDYVRDGLTARKAWFMFPGGILCMGAGITMSAGYPVTTTVEQNLLGAKPSMGENWVKHRTSTYVNLGEGEFVCWTGARTGKWADMCPDYDSTDITKDIFELVINHGINPDGATYAYGITPGGAAPAEALRVFSEEVKIISNTPSVQSASILGVTYTIDWDACSITY